MLLFSALGLGVGLSEDERVNFVGLEHLISRDVQENIRKLTETQKRHVRKVLAGHMYFNVNRLSSLAWMSRASSLLSRKRAYFIASASMGIKCD